MIFASLLSGCLNSSSNSYTEAFEFTLLDGSKKNTSDYKGKVVLLDFMGANCGPCQLQLLVLNELYENYSIKGFEIVSIDVWVIQGETAETMQNLINAYRTQLGVYLNWTFGLDDKEGTLYYKYVNPKGGGVPCLYLLDKNGNIYYSKAGFTNYSTLAEKIEELI